ncbi:MAG: TonB-dependent receptor plug domain-containing protein, partial [Pseudomonadota bacterium]
MSQFPKNVLTLAVLSALAFSAPTMAEEVESSQNRAGSAQSEATDSTDLDRVVVTGNVLYSDQINALRTPTPIIDVPQSLTIVTAEEFQQRGWDSIGDIVDYTPGVNNSQG